MAKVELKQPIVQAIVEDLTDAQSAVIVNYCGLTVAQDTELRKDSVKRSTAVQITWKLTVTYYKPCSCS